MKGWDKVYIKEIGTVNIKIRKVKQLEKDVQFEIMRYLDWLGIFNYKNFTTGIPCGENKMRPNPSAGCPDITCIINGKYIGFEVKSLTGRLSDKQKEFRDKILKAGGHWAVVKNTLDVDICLKNWGLK